MFHNWLDEWLDRYVLQAHTMAMTNSSSHETKINERLESVRAQIAKLEGKTEGLRAEEHNLVIAQNVIAQLSGVEKPSEEVNNPDLFRKNGAHAGRKKRRIRTPGTKRPHGIPTTPDMIRFSIAEATKSGWTGMNGKGLVEQINAKWWPGVDPNYIIPTAWRMAKEGRLKKVGEKYFLKDGDTGEE